MRKQNVESIYRQLFEVCGICKLKEDILEIFTEMKQQRVDPDKVTFGTYYQAFMNCNKTTNS